MKTELDHPIYIPVNFSLFPNTDFLTHLASYLLKALEASPDSKLDVSKCWLNSPTYDIMSAKMLAELKLHQSSAAAKRALPMHELAYAFACDIENTFNIPNDTVAIELNALR